MKRIVLVFFCLAVATSAAFAQALGQAPPLADDAPIDSFVLVDRDGARHNVMMKSGKQVVVIEHRNGFEIRRPKVATADPADAKVDPRERQFFMSLAEARQGDAEAMALFEWLQTSGLPKHGPAGFGVLSRRNQAFGPGGFGPGGFGPRGFGPGSFGPSSFGPSAIAPPNFGGVPPGFEPQTVDSSYGEKLEKRAKQMQDSLSKDLSDMDKRRKQMDEDAKKRKEEMNRLQEDLKRRTRINF